MWKQSKGRGRQAGTPGESSLENRELCFGFVFVFVFVLLLGPHLQHMEVPRLGVESELQLPAYTTAHGTTGSLTH